MGILNLIFSKKPVSDLTQLQQQPVGTVHANVVDQKLENIYGKEKIELQMLYERWVVKENWHLKNEALPLLSGINPENNIHDLPDELMGNIDQLWAHAKNCVEQGLLKVVNREKQEDEWRVSPVDVYRWARVSRVDLPDAFSMLMEFVSKSIQQTRVQTDVLGAGNPDQPYMAFDQNRERVLGIALAILAAYPEQCRNSRGNVKLDKLISLIEEKYKYWLGDETLDLSSTAMRDILGKWLNTLPTSPGT